VQPIAPTMAPVPPADATRPPAPDCGPNMTPVWMGNTWVCRMGN
jgi:hypothetical protein